MAGTHAGRSALPCHTVPWADTGTAAEETDSLPDPEAMSEM